MPDLTSTALVVVDVQQAFDDGEYWGHRNNPGCEANDGTVMSADELARATATQLHEEFATIVSTAELAG